MDLSLQQILFILITGASIFWAVRQYRKIFSNIMLGESEPITGDKGERWNRTILFALGQKKMFKKWLPAVLHGFIYVAFLFTQIELIEIFIDGIFGVHRFFAGKIGFLYPLIINFIEILSLGAFVATIIFLWRRNVITLPRFEKAEMIGWPQKDANLILLGEIVLIIGIFTMNGADVVLQSIDPTHYPDTGPLLISDHLGPALFGGLAEGSLHFFERTGWWLHLFVVLAFLNYLPVSKHLHIFLAFPNAWFSRLKPRGQMDEMPVITNEVRSMMGLEVSSEMSGEGESDELPEFGAHDVTELSRLDILGAYACTECGRCTAVCPANLTGKKLSPRKIMMDIRDRAEEVGELIRTGDEKYIKPEMKKDGVKLSRDNFSDGKSLFDRISKEEIHACTTCQACVEACPVLINPLEPILKLRRYEILTESAGPAEWVPMFNAMENNGAVWQVNEDRETWARDFENEKNG